METIRRAMTLDSRERLIHDNLLRAHIAGNKPLPETPDDLLRLVKTWAELTAGIPENEIQAAFTGAIIDCRYLVPTVKEVLRAYFQNKEKKFNREDWNVQAQKTKGKYLTSDEISLFDDMSTKFPYFKPLIDYCRQGNPNDLPNEDFRNAFFEGIRHLLGIRRAA